MTGKAGKKKTLRDHRFLIYVQVLRNTKDKLGDIPGLRSGQASFAYAQDRSRLPGNMGLLGIKKPLRDQRLL
jgi:hypothetical protein